MDLKGEELQQEIGLNAMYDDNLARKQVLLEACQLFASRELLVGWLPRISVKNFDYCAITEVGMVAPLAPFPVYMCY